MVSRQERIEADFIIAKAEFLGASAEGTAGPKISRLELEDDGVNFEVEGCDGAGAFFLSVAECYPSGETTVFGDVFEDEDFESSGTIFEILDQVLRRLRDGPGSCAAGPPVSPPALQRALSASCGRDDAECSAEAEELESSLKRDLECATRLLGADAIEVAELSSHWRLQVRVGLRSVCGQRAGEPLVSSTTASAWGLDASLPLTVMLHVPKSGYLGAAMPENCVKDAWQTGYEKFLIGQQLVTILNDFCNVCFGRPLEASSCHLVGSDFSPEEKETMEKSDIKKAMLMSEAQADRTLGFLAHLVLYAQSRIMTLHEYCALCDQSFALPPMLLRTVCSRELCSHQFAAFGTRLTTADGVNTQAEIVDLLVCMLAKASDSQRTGVVDPFPTVFVDEPGGAKAAFHPSSKDFGKLKATLSEVMQIRASSAGRAGAAWSTLVAQMSREAVGLVQWITASNRTFLAPLVDDQRIDRFSTPFQYLLISAVPAAERAFQELKARHGSLFAFHGSPVGNWHSILRNGLKNATGTSMQAHGAAYGPGIYMGNNTQLSMGYSGFGHYADPCLSPEPKSGLKRQRTGNRYLENIDRLSMLAVCEVVKHPSLKKHNWGWVAPEEETVCTRLFLVMPEGQEKNVVMDDKLQDQIRELMERLNVGQACKA